MDKALYSTLQGGIFRNVPGDRSAVMRSIKGKGNRSTEIRFRLALVRARIKGFRVNRRVEGTHPDVFFDRERVAVFLDGCFWHGCPNCALLSPRTNAEYWQTKINCNKERDIRMTSMLEDKGIRVLRIWEHELSDQL